MTSGCDVAAVECRMSLLATRRQRMRVKGWVNRGVSLQERFSVEFIAHRVGQYLDTSPLVNPQATLAVVPSELQSRTSHAPSRASPAAYPGSSVR